MQGQYAFATNNGQPELLLPGRHVLMSPLNSPTGEPQSIGDPRIESGPISVIRVNEGQLGFALADSKWEVLLPGVHARCNGAFKFQFFRDACDELIEAGPIKFLTVASGGVRVCYIDGKVNMFQEGRYAINSATFVVKNMRLDKHVVLLDGGISMIVEGLLTYQVHDPERLILQLGDKDLVRSIKDVAKAELSRVFATLHLEQISRSGGDKAVGADSVSAARYVISVVQAGTAEGETRIWICKKVVNFQLESTAIADAKYASDYESASLAMAKAKAQLRAVVAENQIQITKANTTAEAMQISARAQKEAQILAAEGVAESRKIDASARNQSAEIMRNEFARKFAVGGLQVDFARALKAQVLTVVPGSAVGGALMSNAMFSAQK